ncbi:hypothetical protein BGZ63DRAFT_357708 [Mariannaea sp. PMI_226]|nr:hypothetical protein BGZ63DRAFT_357708 [Mariannaea sp. PMI_226]
MDIRAARYKVIHLVREGITEEYRLPDLLSAILILATTESTSALPSHKEINPFTPPPLGSKWLEVYTQKPISEVHWHAIETLIRMHGGIHKLKTYGSAWQISLTGLMRSTMIMTQPPYPLISPEGYEYPDISPLQYLGIQNAPASVSAIGGFSLLQIENIQSSVIKRFVELREFVFVSENLASAQSQPFHRDTLMDCRNLIQHRLLSLPDSSDPSSSDLLFVAPSADNPQMRMIYESCLSTALLFSIHVIFPLPAPSIPRTILLDRLLVALSSVDIIAEILLPGWSEMSLWCAFIGGIAALNSENRGFFVAKIKDAALACGLESWEQTRAQLERFIWLGLACDARAIELWREACKLMQDTEGVMDEMEQ